MTGASLGYSGDYYSTNSLVNVGIAGLWWSSTITSTERSYNFLINSSGGVSSQGNNNKLIGRAVRYNEITNFFIATQSGSTALIEDIRFKQTYVIYI